MDEHPKQYDGEEEKRFGVVQFGSGEVQANGTIAEAKYIIAFITGGGELPPEMTKSASTLARQATQAAGSRARGDAGAHQCRAWRTGWGEVAGHPARTLCP